MAAPQFAQFRCICPEGTVHVVLNQESFSAGTLAKDVNHLWHTIQEENRTREAPLSLSNPTPIKEPMFIGPFTGTQIVTVGYTCELVNSAALSLQDVEHLVTGKYDYSVVSVISPKPPAINYSVSFRATI